jgi:hypothetical protein
MTIHKVNKYLFKLSNEPVGSEKFGIYLDKLNFWHNQIGSGHVSLCKDQSINLKDVNDPKKTIKCTGAYEQKRMGDDSLQTTNCVLNKTTGACSRSKS